MLIKNGAIKSIMSKNVKIDKLNFRNRDLIKENQSYKSIACIVCKGRM